MDYDMSRMWQVKLGFLEDTYIEDFHLFPGGPDNSRMRAYNLSLPLFAANFLFSLFSYIKITIYVLFYNISATYCIFLGMKGSNFNGYFSGNDVLRMSHDDVCVPCVPRFRRTHIHESMRVILFVWYFV
jgi:hypothetical protein